MMKSLKWTFMLLIVSVFLLAGAIQFGCNDEDDDNDSGKIWTDSETDLTWVKSPADSLKTWTQAMNYCDSFDFSGKSDWRLPTIDELRTIIYGCEETEPGGECGMVDGCLACWTDICEACEEMYQGVMDTCLFSGALYGGCEQPYWSSSVDETDENSAGAVNFFNGTLLKPAKDFEYQVRCVRGGSTASE